MSEPGPADLLLLRCPRCGGAFDVESSALRCARCLAVYEVRGGIPDLLPWSGGVPGSEWSRWREKLDSLQQWRAETWEGGSATEARQRVADELAAEFFKFMRVPETGTVLDIGCGSAELRRFVPRRRYVGLDPLVGTPGAPEPPPAAAGDLIVRGVGEKLPFADGVFETVMICETLDHALDPVLVIREARRVLKEGGLLAILQSVRLEIPAPGLAVRARVSAGRLKARLLGRARVQDADTKMHALGQDQLAAMAGSEMIVESGVTRGEVMFLRVLKQDPAAARRPKRDVGTA